MAISPEVFARRARGFANDLPDLERKAVASAALMVKTTAVGELRRAVGGDLRMSGVGKRGARVNARYDAGRSAQTAVVRAMGPVHLVESATRPHRIPKVRGARARKRFVVIPGVGVRSNAQHPGTRGKRPWGKALDKSLPKVPAVIKAETAKALRGHFGG